MELFGFSITRKASPPPNTLPVVGYPGGGGWWPVVREPFTGAWQQNADVRPDTAMAYYAVFACTTLIASDVAKLRLRLVERDRDGVWHETENPAYSPVLRVPNHYQTITQFITVWIVSKLSTGNAYVWLERDQRGVVIAMYVLDPGRVVPLVTPLGDVYYELRKDPLSGVTSEDRIIVPARDLIHDRMVPLFHPLIGVTPIYACGMAALQGLAIQGNSQAFFTNGANPSGMLTAPGSIPKDTMARLLATVHAKKPGDVLIGGDGLKYEQFSMSAVDAQLIEQLKWTAENVCSCYHTPAYMIGIGPPPPYANIEPLLQQYYSQCIQSLLTNFEGCLDAGLGVDEKVNGVQYGTEFDIDDLIWMDSATKTKAAADAIGCGAMSPNEARAKYFGLGPVEGGETPYMQSQNYSLASLAKRDAATPTPAPKVDEPAPDDTTDDATDDPPPDEGDDSGDDDATGSKSAAWISALMRRAVAHELFR